MEKIFVPGNKRTWIMSLSILVIVSAFCVEVLQLKNRKLNYLLSERNQIEKIIEDSNNTAIDGGDL